MDDPLSREYSLPWIRDALLATFEVLAAFEENNRTIVALRATLAVVTKKFDDLTRQLAGSEQHHVTAQKALGLTGFESRPYAAYIYDLKQQLAQVEQERDNWRQLSENYTKHVKSLDERHLDLKQQLADAHAKIRLLENKS